MSAGALTGGAETSEGRESLLRSVKTCSNGMGAPAPGWGGGDTKPTLSWTVPEGCVVARVDTSVTESGYHGK